MLYPALAVGPVWTLRQKVARCHSLPPVGVKCESERIHVMVLGVGPKMTQNREKNKLSRRIGDRAFVGVVVLQLGVKFARGNRPS